jgi:hypothetical protein
VIAADPPPVRPGRRNELASMSAAEVVVELAAALSSDADDELIAAAVELGRRIERGEIAEGPRVP